MRRIHEACYLKNIFYKLKREVMNNVTSLFLFFNYYYLEVNVFFAIFAPNKIIHYMDYRTYINNFSYGVTMNGRNDIKIISFNINLSDVSEEYGNVVMRVDSFSKDDEMSSIKELIIDDLSLYNWIEREDKFPLLLDSIANFYICNQSKINLEELSDLLHFAVNIFFDWDISCNSFSEYLFLFRKFTLLSIPCTEMQLALYDEIINYFK